MLITDIKVSIVYKAINQYVSLWLCIIIFIGEIIDIVIKMKNPTKIRVLPQASDRLFILEFLKAISIVSVVSFHAIFLPQSTYISSNGILETLFAPLRFCVPVFLTISFFLFEHQVTQIPKLQQLSLLKKRLVRLLIPALFWFGVAAGLKLINGNSYIEIINQIIAGEIFTGSYYFLIIFQLMLLFILIGNWLNSEKNIFTIITTQVILIVSIYGVISGFFGSQPLTFLVKLERSLIIYWFGYIALGVYLYKNWLWISEKSTSLSNQNKAIILFSTALIMMLEYRILTLLLANSLRPFDYAALSCILSVPAIFICFASVNENNFPLPMIKIIKLLSKYSLGIFCINGILSQLFTSVGSKVFSELTFNLSQIILIKIIGWVILLVLSLLISIILKKMGLKRVVC